MSLKKHSLLNPSCHKIQYPAKSIIIIIIVFAVANQCSASEFNDTTDFPPPDCDPCPGEDDDYCYNDSLCCVVDGNLTCRCTDGYHGRQCEYINTAESKSDRRVYLALMTQIFSLLLVLFILVILVLVIFCVHRKSKQPKSLFKDSMENMDKELIYVRDELKKLTPTERQSNILRLSKMIEATARVTLISYPGLMGIHKERINSNFPTCSKPQNRMETRSNSAPSLLGLAGRSDIVKSVKIEKPRGGMSVRFAKPSIRKFFSMDE